MDRHSGRVRPRSRRGQLFVRRECLALQAEMACRVESEAGAPQAMCIVIAAGIGEPASHDAKVRRTIAATAAPFVQRGHGGQQLGDSGARLGAQQFRLRLDVALTDEPARQSAPAFTPVAQALVESRLVLLTRRAVASLAGGGERQQRLDVALQLRDARGNHAGTGHQVTDEALQVIDQTLFECDHSLCVGLLQFDRARDAGHECLGIVGQAFEDAHQIPQYAVDLCLIRCRLG